MCSRTETNQQLFSFFGFNLTKGESCRPAVSIYYGPRPANTQGDIGISQGVIGAEAIPGARTLVTVLGVEMFAIGVGQRTDDATVQTPPPPKGVLEGERAASIQRALAIK